RAASPGRGAPWGRSRERRRGAGRRRAGPRRGRRPRGVRREAAPRQVAARGVRRPLGLRRGPAGVHPRPPGGPRQARGRQRQRVGPRRRPGPRRPGAGGARGVPPASAAARVWRDHNSHAAVEYERGTRLVRYLSFTPSGLRKFEDGIEKFERRFCRPLVREPRALALSLIRATKGAYIPGDGVIEILWEIYMQAASEGKGVEAMNGAELVAVYNDLAAAAGRGPVKAFKSKAEAVKRIGALRAAAAQPTDEQAANRARAAEDAARRLASLKKEDDGAAPAKK